MDSTEKQWFVMRDLKRRICNSLAIHDLTKAGLEVFTPMTNQTLDPFVELYSTLQYRFQRGKSVNEPMTVRDAEMERFIRAVSTDDTPIYYKYIISPAKSTNRCMAAQSA